MLKSYLVYILEQRIVDPSVCDINELRSCVQILTNKGVMNPTVTPVHFTPKYGNTIDLARQLPSKPLVYKITLVSRHPSRGPLHYPVVWCKIRHARPKVKEWDIQNIRKSTLAGVSSYVLNALVSNLRFSMRDKDVIGSWKGSVELPFHLQLKEVVRVRVFVPLFC